MLPASNEKLRKAQKVEQDLRAVLARDPTDERTYVVLGTFLLQQRRISEARSIYEEGCAVAQGENAYIWTAMANLERKVLSPLLHAAAAKTGGQDDTTHGMLRHRQQATSATQSQCLRLAKLAVRSRSLISAMDAPEIQLAFSVHTSQLLIAMLSDK